MKKNKRYVRICAALLCAVLCLSVNVAPAMAAKVTQADIDALKGNAASLDKKQKEIQSKLNSLKNDKAAAVQKKTLLDDQIANTNAKISNTEAQISDYNALISQAETELADAQQREEAQYELFCKRVREMEERGTISYWSVLFKANSFSDLLGSLDFINEVMDYDRQVISDLQTTRRQLTEDKAALEQQKSEMESSQTKLQQQVDAASTLIREYEETEAGHQAMLDEAAEDEARIQALIRQQQSGGSSGGGGSSGSNSGVDGYIWPTNNTRVVTSPYGERWCPFHGYESHNGADIDAARGSAVLAAKSGRVIQAGWNGGYGISVMIAHDDGITTLYGHMDGCSVSVGQTVSQGETIGICGNTGNSSGAHIHYTMYKNGGTIDPLPYLPGYIAWDW